MILSDFDLAAIKSMLATWEAIERVGALIVLVGVIGEYVAEFSDFAKQKKIDKKLEKLSCLILICGLAVELAGLVKTSELSGQVIGALEHTLRMQLSSN